LVFVYHVYVIGLPIGFVNGFLGVLRVYERLSNRFWYWLPNGYAIGYIDGFTIGFVNGFVSTF